MLIPGDDAFPLECKTDKKSSCFKVVSEKQKIKQEEVVSLLKVVMIFDDVYQAKYFSCNYQDK